MVQIRISDVKHHFSPRHPMPEVTPRTKSFPYRRKDVECQKVGGEVDVGLQTHDKLNDPFYSFGHQGLNEFE